MVINRIRAEEEEKVIKSAREIDIEILGCIPEDENIAKHDFIGKPILDIDDTSPSIAAVKEIVAQLELPSSSA